MGQRDADGIGDDTSTPEAARILAAGILHSEYEHYKRMRQIARQAETDDNAGVREVAARLSTRAMKRVNAALRLYHFAELDSRGALSTVDRQEEALATLRAKKCAQEALGAPVDFTALSEATERVRKIPCRMT